MGEAGVYLTRIVDRKVSHGKTFLVTDGGMHHQLAASGNFGQVVRRNYPVAIANRWSGAEEEASIVGCLCTPLDRLADDVMLPRAEVGDMVAVFLAGAYGLSASPQAFLGHPPAREIVVGGDSVGVQRLDEIQPVGRRVEAQRGAVVRLQRPAQIVRRPFAAADQLQAADHRAHLVVEERARRGLDLDPVAAADDVKPVERLDRAFGLAMRRAEGGEIVPPDQELRRFVHRVGVERHRHAPRPPGLQRQRRAAVEDAVDVAAADAAEARVPVVGDDLRLEDRDRRRAAAWR